jgi:hypothetical protein
MLSNKVLSQRSKWFSANKLPLNLEKTNTHIHTSTEEQSTYLKNTNRDKVQSITAAPEKGKQQSTAVFFNVHFKHLKMANYG